MHSIVTFPQGRALDIIPVGRVAIDFNPVDYFKTLAQSETFKKYLGGSPANIAVGMARLGHKVGFLGAVSHDRFGDFVTEFFANEGIDTSHIVRAKHGESLGLTFTEILSREESSILMYREGVADLALEPGDADEGYIASSQCVLISGTALSASPSREAALKTLALAKRAGCVVIFDADYRAYTWKNDDEVALYCAWAAEKADIIMGSREEFDRMERLLSLPGTDEQSADYWLGQGARLLIIKHGKQGSFAYTNDERYRVKPFPVEALKGFGGGDGYASGLLHGLMRAWPLRDALEFATAEASMLVASHACSKDMPDEDAVHAFIQSEKARYGEAVEAL